MKINPYLSFEGRCEEAIEFYKSAVGAKVNMILRCKDSPEKPPSGSFPPGVENKIMHANLSIGESTVLVTDGHNKGNATFTGITLTLSIKTEAEADRYFAALLEGGKILMPLAKTFFSPRFGMVSDRFGVGWIIIVEH
jgi:PhnB protein